MQLVGIPYLVCGASKLQLSHPLNKRNNIPPTEQAKKFSFISIQTGRHSQQNTSEFTMKVGVNLKSSCFEIIDTIQSEFSHRFSDFDMSLMKSVRVPSPASNCFLDREELQPLYSVVNSTTKTISTDLLNETTSVKKHCLIKAS